MRVRNRKKSVWRKEKYSLLEFKLCRCSKCKIIKELTEDNFSKRSDNKTGFSSWCRLCQRVHAKQTMKEKREDDVQKVIVKASKTKHLKSEKGIKSKRKRNQIRNHKKRSIVFNWTLEDWNRCKEYFKNKCVYCQAEEVILTQDHFIALNNINCPGTVILNMVPACVKCNSSKQDKNPYDWCTEEAIVEIEKYFKSFVL